MPLRNTKTYTIVSPALATNGAPLPANPDRIGLRIQNTGAQPGLARFGSPVQGNGSDMLFASGLAEKWTQADTTPVESVSFYSAAGTTWSVMETVLPGSGK